MVSINTVTFFRNLQRGLVIFALFAMTLVVSACDIPGLNDGRELPDETPVVDDQEFPGQTGQDSSDDADVPEDDAVEPQLPDEAFQIDPDGDDGAEAADPVSIVEGGLKEPRTLNPILVDDPLGDALSRLVFSGLTRLNPETGDPEPDLASSWETNDDHTVYRFNIREGVTWHDDQPLTAQDVEFTFELMMDNRTRSPRFSRIVERVSAVEAIDSETVEFRLISPYSALPATIATFGIVPQHALGNVLPDELVAEPFGTDSAIGTGPFQFVHWDRGERIVFEANRNHHEMSPAIDQYEYRVADDNETFLDELDSGEIDWARIGPELLEDVDALDSVEARGTSGFDMISVVLQKDSGVTTRFAEREVRQALLHALDREEMVQTIWNGRAAVAHSIIPDISWAAAEPETQYDYDPERAEQLLDDAGWSIGEDGVRQRDGQRLEFSLLANGDNPVRRELAEWLVVQWQEIGIDASVNFETWSNVRDQITTSRDFQSLLFGYRWDVDPNQHAMWSSDSITGGFNLASYMNQDVDQLLNDALAVADQDTRAENYREMQELVLSDLPVLPLAYPEQLLAIGPRLHAEEQTAILLRNRANVAGWVPEDVDEAEDRDDA